MTDQPSRRPPADSPKPSAEAPATPALDNSPKATPTGPGGEPQPTYTIETLEDAAQKLRQIVLFGWEPTNDTEAHEAAAILAADFLDETVGTLKRQRYDRRRRAAQAIMETRRRRGRGRRR